MFAERAWTLVTLFLRFRRELEGHMKREEITRFPFIEQLQVAVAEGTPKPRYSFGSLSNAILFMNEDHEFGHKVLKLMDEISHGFTPGADAPQFMLLRWPACVPSPATWTRTFEKKTSYFSLRRFASNQALF